MSEPNRNISDAFGSRAEPLAPRAEHDTDKRYQRVRGEGREAP